MVAAGVRAGRWRQGNAGASGSLAAVPIPDGASRSARPAAIPRGLVDVALRAGVELAQPSWTNIIITGITHDSRAVLPGDIYAALPGGKTHGARFAAAAAAAGASAILTDEAGAAGAGPVGVPLVVVPAPRAVLGRIAAYVYGEPAASLLMIGITGTSGKTTTSYLVEAGLRAAGRTTGLIGTVETRLAGEPLDAAGGDAPPHGHGLTTPESTDLHALFAMMRERGVDSVAMEVSSHALAYGRVDGITFDVAVFTNLSQDHLDFHGDMAGYFAAKRALFTPQRARLGVVNVDDDYGRQLATSAEIPIVTVSPSGASHADWSARGIEAGIGSGQTGFTLVGPDALAVASGVGVLGRFNVANAALALVALVAAGVNPAAAAAGVAACSGVPGRMERIEVGQAFLAVVDYAHKPAAISTVLRALREATKGRLIAVVGCGGDRDMAKRPLMGAAAARDADVVVITDDNPRSEDPAAIRAAALSGTRRVATAERADVIEIGDRRAAIRYAVALAGPHDTVAVLGKGHEQGQERAGRVTPFDDRAQLRAVIEESR